MSSAPSPSSSSTTSRSSTTTSSTATWNGGTARRCGPSTASGTPSSPAMLLRLSPSRSSSRRRRPSAVRTAARLAEATQAMIAGQAEDMASERRALALGRGMPADGGTERRGLCSSCATAIGAVLAGAPQATVEALAEFGRHLGIAFQAVDDVLGIWGEPSVTGKPVGNDLRQHKKTLPIVARPRPGRRHARRPRPAPRGRAHRGRGRKGDQASRALRRTRGDDGHRRGRALLRARRPRPRAARAPADGPSWPRSPATSPSATDEPSRAAARRSESGAGDGKPSPEATERGGARLEDAAGDCLKRAVEALVGLQDPRAGGRASSRPT